MYAFLTRRLATIVPTLLFVTMLIFGLQQLLPGDPAIVLAGEDRDPSVVEYLRKKMHLDEPLPVRYLYWLSGVMQGDLGESLRMQKPVTALIAEKLPVTLELAAIAIVIALGHKSEPEAKPKIVENKMNAITFQPIDDKKSAPEATPDAGVAAVPDKAETKIDDKTDDKIEKTEKVEPIQRPKKDPRKPKEKEPKDTTPPKSEMTLAILGQKVRSTSAQYQTYKQKNGMQLDAEWNELMQYLQNKSKDNLDEAARRLDNFRAKMRD